MDLYNLFPALVGGSGAEKSVTGAVPLYETAMCS